MKCIFIFCTLTLAILSSCTSTRVAVEKDKYQNFKLSDYSSFDFAKIETPNDSLLPYQQAVQLLKQGITQAMEARGLSRSEATPELLINLGLVVEDKVQTRETNLATDPFTYTGQRSYRWEVQEIPVGTYREGSLTVHLVESSGSRLVWAGTISEVIPKKEKNKAATVQDAVDQIFEYLDNN